MRRQRHKIVASLAGIAVLAGACGADESDSADSTAPPTTTALVESTTTTAAVANTAGPAALAEIDLALEPVAVVPAPIAMTPVPGDDGRAWVADRDGRLFEIDLEAGSEQGEGTEVLDFSDDVNTDGEQGFLGVAVAQDGAHLYTSYSDPDGATRIDEYTVEDGVIDENSRREVFDLPQPFGNHNGGNIVIGPDGLLYLGLGDGGSAGDPEGHGQNTTTLLGSMIRIDPTPAGDRSYTTPTDNPFTDDDGQPDIWLYGVRNPWRFSFDRATGDLWIADVGQGDIEEINRLSAGNGEPAGRAANLGWNLVEGSREFAGAPPPDHTPPVFEYDHGEGNCSVTGGFVYRGDEITALDGAYLFADYCVSEVRALRVTESGEIDERAFGIGTDTNTLVSFGEDAAGELYVLSSAGEISRIVSA